MKKSKFLKTLILALSLSGLASCGESDSPGNDLPADDGVTAIEIKAAGLSNDILTIAKGKTTTIAASVKPTGVNANLTWTIGDPTIASIENSKLTGIKGGETSLCVSAARIKKEIKVVVEDYVPLTGVNFESSINEITSGQRKQLKYSLVPENATTKTLNFSVTPNDGLVTINSSGIVEINKEAIPGDEYTVTASGTVETKATGTTKIKVKEFEVEDVLLLDNSFTKEVTEITVPLDEPYRVLFAMVEPEKALAYESKLPVTWTSSDPTTVAISDKGRMTFLKKGSVTITMKSTVKGKSFTKTCAVTVTDPCGDFIENYHIPSSYISKVSENVVNSSIGWQSILDFRSGGTASVDAKKVVLENYKPQTGPSSWFAGGGYCIEMGGWDNIHSGLEDDDLPGGGMANLIMWSKVKFNANSTKLRTYFEYRQTDATFKYKLRHTLIDVATKEVKHLTDWQSQKFATDPNLEGTETYIESLIPEAWRGKTVLMVLEYDDIDYTTDGILNGCESVNIKNFNVLNDTGVVADNALWIIGDSNTSIEYTGELWANIASDTSMTLFRDTISGRTIAPASSIGIVDHIDAKHYENSFEPFGSPKIICIQCGGNDLFWARQEGNALKIGEPSSTNKNETYGAIKYMLTYFTTRYPEAKIIMATAKYRLVDVGSYPNSEADTFNANLKTICANYTNVSVFDMCADLYNAAGKDETAYNAMFIADHIHFNTQGQSVMRGLWVNEINKVKGNA